MIDNNRMFKALFSEKSISLLYSYLIQNIELSPDIYAEYNGKKINTLVNATITITGISFSTNSIITVYYNITCPNVEIMNNTFITTFKYDVKTNRYSVFNTSTNLANSVNLKDVYPSLVSYRSLRKINLTSTINKLQLLLGK